MRVDVRERIVTLSPQEVLTSDGVALRVTAAVVWQVSDPVAFHERAESPEGVVHLAAQLGLREALSALDTDTVLTEGRRSVTGAVTSAAAAAGEPVGIAVREAVVKDVLLPPRPQPCVRWPTAQSCSTSTRAWHGCDSSSRSPTAPR